MAHASSAMAAYDLRRTGDEGKEHYPEVKEFVLRNFYVDDGMVSIPKAEEVATLIRNTQDTLASANLKLHKVVSKSVNIMKAFPTEELAKDIRCLDLKPRQLAGAAFTRRSLELGDRSIYLQGIRTR